MRNLRAAGAAVVSVVALVIAPAPWASATHGADVRVSVGSPPTPFSQNKQNEPALAVDAAHPNVLVAGANDNIDMEACNAGDPTTCPFTPGVGVSGVYFSFDRGDTWTQPTYRGLTARDCLGPAACTAHPGPIGTLPRYASNGLASDGDPAVAFGPRPTGGGRFSFAGGSRLYYANLTSNVGATRSEQVFRGFEAIAVSRTDDPRAAAAGGPAGEAAWRDPVIISRQSSTTFSDKEQIWADNAASSPHFGSVYVCWASFRSQEKGKALPVPLMVARSTDGGDTWTTRQVGPAASNANHTQPDGCTVRTDSRGNVYVFGLASRQGTQFEAMYRSTDGGAHFRGPTSVATVTPPGVIDPVLGRPVMDGVAGARADLAAGPSVDIANGAPTGADATDQLVLTYVDGSAGLNNERALLTTSTNRGASWSAPRDVGQPGAGPGRDRPIYTAPAISPDGRDFWLVYNAFTTPFRQTTATPRRLVGVVRHADIAPGGAVGPVSTVERGVPGDPRASSQNNLTAEFLGDYVYAVATRDYGAGVWNDVRAATDCPAIDAYRQSLYTSTPSARPQPQQQCPPTWGNTDIFGGSFLDPTTP